MMELMLEVTPPSRRASDASVLASVEKVAQAAKSIGNVNYINIPEVVEENYAGVPFYRHYDTRKFSGLLKKKTKAEMIVNKITVFLKSEEEFSSWIKESISRYGIRRFVFVGGSREAVDYPGPPVTKANQMAKRVNGIQIGNICIPSRKDEAARMVSKTESGASFFTTQILFDPVSIKKVLASYEKECLKSGIEPAAVFLSFAAASMQFDLDFLEWLGAEIPADTNVRLRRSRDISLSLNKLYAAVLADITDFVSDNGISIPLGLNVESISHANLDKVCSLAKYLSEGPEGSGK